MLKLLDLSLRGRMADAGQVVLKNLLADPGLGSVSMIATRWQNDGLLRHGQVLTRAADRPSTRVLRQTQTDGRRNIETPIEEAVPRAFVAGGRYHDMSSVNV